MSSGFVSSSELDDERRKRQDEWEKVRQPDDPQQAPEPEPCNKTLYEQLKDNREAKQAEIDEARKFKNMIRGIDEDESDFLSHVDEIKVQALLQNKKEEEELLKQMASNRVVVGEAPVLTKIAPVSNGTKPVSSQANILSAAIKRKATKEEDPASKVCKKENDDKVKPAVSAQQVIGSISGLVNYEASSDSDSTDSDPGFLPSLQISDTKKKQQQT